jgi:hypothetical protein
MTTLDILPAVVPAAHIAGPPQGRWTYVDYAALPDDGQRYAIIDGVLYTTPAPGTGHQSISHLIAMLLTCKGVEDVEDVWRARTWRTCGVEGVRRGGREACTGVKQACEGVRRARA